MTPGDERVLADYQHALAQLKSTREQVEAARESLLNVALDGYGSESINRLVLWHASADQLPAEYRVVHRTDEQGRQILGALRAEQRAHRLNQPLDSGHAAILAEIRRNYDVVEAKHLLDMHLQSINAVFGRYAQ